MHDMGSLAYLAGFFDGEGCISTWTQPGKHRDNHYWEVNATQSEKNGNEPLCQMLERWGGSIFLVAPLKAHHSPIYRWKARGIEAAIALHDMYPHLQIKKQQATNALEALRSKPKIRRILQRLREPKP